MFTIGIIVYLFIGTIIGAVILSFYLNDAGSTDLSDICEDEIIPTVLGGLFWPISIFILLGKTIAKAIAIRREIRETRDEYQKTKSKESLKDWDDKK